VSEFVPVAEVSSLPPGEGRTVHVKGREFALYNVDGKFLRALDDECPHKGGPLGAGMLDQGKIVCPLHGWAFDPESGTCDVRSDKIVKTYPTRVRMDKWKFVFKE